MLFDRIRFSRAAALAVAAAQVSTCPAAHSAQYDAFRIMTFNICHCATHYSLSVTDEDVRRTAGVIAAQAPDFVCLQEVDKATTRSAGIDQTARIAALLTEATGETHYGTFGKGRDYQGGEFGVAIIAKQAPLSVSTTPIAGTEPRSLLVCEFEDFCVATVHLDTNRDWRTNSIAVIREALAAWTKPVFVTGDWNATPATDATIPLLEEFLTIVSPKSGISTFTSRDDTGDYVIDYVAVDSRSAGGFLVRRGWSVPNQGEDGRNSSDHNPVMVDVVKRPAAGALAWVEENAVAAGMTGAWSRDVAYDPATLRAALLGDSTFTPAAPSGGNVVTNVVTAAFGADRADVTPGPDAQAAIRLGANGRFQAWTKRPSEAEGSKVESTSAGGADYGGVWIDLEAGGVEPEDGAECTFRVIIDYVAGRYAVELLDGGAWLPCAALGVDATLPAGTLRFPLASSGRRVGAIDFLGETVFSSLHGSFGLRPWPTAFSIR